MQQHCCEGFISIGCHPATDWGNTVGKAGAFTWDIDTPHCLPTLVKQPLETVLPYGCLTCC